DLLEALSRRDYPGNVRELRNAVERAVITGDAGEWEGILTSRRSTTVPPGAVEASDLSFRDAKAIEISRWEREYLANLMKGNANNLSRAARTAKMDRSHLRDLLKRYQLYSEE